MKHLQPLEPPYLQRWPRWPAARRPNTTLARGRRRRGDARQARPAPAPRRSPPSRLLPLCGPAKPTTAAATDAEPPVPPSPAAPCRRPRAEARRRARSAQDVRATWKCEGKQPAGPMETEQDYKSDFKARRTSRASRSPRIQPEEVEGRCPPSSPRLSGSIGREEVRHARRRRHGRLGHPLFSGREADKLTFTGDGQMGGRIASARRTPRRARSR